MLSAFPAAKEANYIKSVFFIIGPVFGTEKLGYLLTFDKIIDVFSLDY